MRTIELVKWLDPQTDVDWHTGDNGAMPSECWSVGLLITDHKDYIVLAGDWSGTDTNTRMVIPTGCIVSRTLIYSVE